MPPFMTDQLMHDRAVQFKNYAGAEGFAGGEDYPAQAVFVPGKRRRVNIVAVCVNLLLPWLAFASLFCILSFRFHYERPFLAWFLVALYSAVAIAACVKGAQENAKRDREPMWFNYGAWATVIAVLTATVFGCMNFMYNQAPYYEMNALNSYPSVNPATDWGQQTMDAGRVYFSDGTGLDLKKSISFKNSDEYCVAPIVNGDTKLSHYDFWAVGINCCSGGFRCGQFNNPKARSGLRLLWDEQRPLFRLAVQMAEAVYNVKSPHPLFFYWVQDPVEEMNQYREAGEYYCIVGLVAFFAVNLFAVCSAMVIFAKIGQM